MKRAAGRAPARLRDCRMSAERASSIIRERYIETDRERERKREKRDREGQRAGRECGRMWDRSWNVKEGAEVRAP